MKTVGLVVVVLIGLVIFVLGINELRKQSAGENILGAILDIILGNFFSSTVFMVILGILMMISGMVGLIK